MAHGARWQFVLADQDGGDLVELRDAFGVRVQFGRNRAAQVEGYLDFADPALRELYAVLSNGVPQLRAFRDGELRFRGSWVAMQDKAHDTELSNVHWRFRDPFDRMEGEVTDPLLTYTATDAGAIASDLITRTGTTALAVGSIEATATRGRTYEHAVVARAIRALTEVEGGFDFEVVPLMSGVALGRFDVHASLGTDKSATVSFQYGEGTAQTVLEVRRSWLPPVNFARVTGEDDTYAEASDVASIARYGRFGVVESASDGTVLAATLQEKADALLRPDPIEVVTFTPDPATAPQPWVDYWLGDRVGLFARRGGMLVDEAPRVNGLEVVVSDDDHGEDEHRLTFDTQEA